MVSGNLAKGKVFGFLHVRSPPLGCADALSGNLGIGVDVVKAAGSVEAGIRLKDGTAGICKREVVGEVCNCAGIVQRKAIEEVVSSCHCHVGSGLVLCVGTLENGLSGHVQEKVLLE